MGTSKIQDQTSLFMAHQRRASYHTTFRRASICSVIPSFKLLPNLIEYLLPRLEFLNALLHFVWVIIDLHAIHVSALLQFHHPFT